MLYKLYHSMNLVQHRKHTYIFIYIKLRIYNLLHWSQATRTGRFEAYDYGYEDNIIIYDSEKPPSFDIKSITIPIAIFYGDKDYLSNSDDVNYLLSELPNVIYSEKVLGFRHNDFVWGKLASSTIYLKIIELIKKYNASNDIMQEIERIEEKIVNLIIDEGKGESVVEKDDVNISTKVSQKMTKQS